ncbi:unnamed protein product [Symbiodinium microadriaticum]|nr:unnamed protein product [Symbiodinium sp. KB8]CAE7879512.1 unnamed protein product [Symbiodinium microadriaticum]
MKIGLLWPIASAEAAWKPLPINLRPAPSNFQFPETTGATGSSIEMAFLRWMLAVPLASITGISLRLCSEELVERAGLLSRLTSEYAAPFVYQSGRELVSLQCRRNSSQLPDKWHMVRYDLPPSLAKKLRPAFPPKLCPMCKGGGGSGPTLFLTERTDGLGSRAQQLLHTLALASFLHIDFGGVVPSKDETPHGVNTARALSNLLGFDVSKLKVGADDEFDICFYSFPDFLTETLQHHCLQWPLHSSMMVAAYDVLHALPVSNWEPGFLAELRQQTALRNWPLRHFQKGGRPKVVMHVRRGDVVGRGKNLRNFPDEVHFRLAEQIRQDLPQAEVHVFSTTKEAQGPVDFAGYEARGMIVHLDGEEVDDWAHMVQADILVMAPSAFSWVAALINEKCVLAFRGTEALPDWIVHTGTLHDEQHAQLGRCIDDRILTQT